MSTNPLVETQASYRTQPFRLDFDKTPYTYPFVNKGVPLDYGIRGPSQFDSRELVSLRRERDPELRAEAMFSLARRAERHSRPQISAQIYAELSASEELPASTRSRAQRRLAALNGDGEVGDQMESLASRFVSEASDPATLLAMTAAGFAFQGTRFLMLSRFAASASSRPWVRGWASRAIAGLTASGVEASVFPLAGRLGNLALGRELDWSRSALGRDLASSFLMLGALRAGGLTSRSLAGRSALLRPLIQQAGMFGGIVLGHELEILAGLRPRTSGANALLHSLSTLLQFNVAGRLNRSLLGERARSWERSLETRGAALERSTFSGPGIAWNFGPEALLAGQASRPRSPDLAIGPDIVRMEGNDGRGRPPLGGGKVLSMAEFLNRRRQKNQGQTESPEVEETPPTGSDAVVGASAPEFWLPQIRAAVMVWVAEIPIHPDIEFNFIRDRLAEYSPELTPLFGYMAIRHPLAAKLLALRLHLVREHSWLWHAPEVQAAARETAWSHYSEAERLDIFSVALQRYFEATIFNPNSRLHGATHVKVDQYIRAFEATPPPLVEAWRDPLLGDDQFLHLSWWLGIFPRS